MKASSSCPHCGRRLIVAESGPLSPLCPGCGKNIADSPTEGVTATSQRDVDPVDFFQQMELAETSQATDANPFADRHIASNAAAAPIVDANINPYAAPATGPGNLVTVVSNSGRQRRGLPWEEMGPSVKSFFATVKMILMSTGSAFRTMRQSGGYVSPFFFAIIGTTIGLFADFLIQLPLQQIAIRGNSGFNRIRDNDFDASLLSLVILIGVGVIAPLISMFFVGGIFHLFLMMLGGKRKSFETTARVCAYAQGALGLVSFIPFLRFWIGLFTLYVWISRLQFAHETTSGKAAVAVLFPLILTCGTVIAVVAMFGPLGR